VEDIRAIREFIERDSPRYGRLVAERLVESTSQISRFPKAGQVVPEIGRADAAGLQSGRRGLVRRTLVVDEHMGG